MRKKTLKFNNVEVNKKEFHTSKQPIALNLVNVDQILISDKNEHSDCIVCISIDSVMKIKKRRIIHKFI